MIKKSNKKPRFKKFEMHRDLPDVYRYGGKCITNKRTGDVYGDSQETKQVHQHYIKGCCIESPCASSGIKLKRQNEGDIIKHER